MLIELPSQVGHFTQRIAEILLISRLSQSPGCTVFMTQHVVPLAWKWMPGPRPLCNYSEQFWVWYMCYPWVSSEVGGCWVMIGQLGSCFTG